MQYVIALALYRRLRRAMVPRTALLNEPLQQLEMPAEGRFLRAFLVPGASLSAQRSHEVFVTGFASFSAASRIHSRKRSGTRVVASSHI